MIHPLAAAEARVFELVEEQQCNFAVKGGEDEGKTTAVAVMAMHQRRGLLNLLFLFIALTGSMLGRWLAHGLILMVLWK